jgi:lipopolysaccharide transport system ATP-binding protein
MSDIAIVAEGLSKLYRLGAPSTYRTLRETITGALTNPFKPSAPPADADSTQLWALKDVSFEVKRGEVIGVIGRNGAGKSTLLKILARITEPTKGRAKILGRVGALLEVGTGFHPELTGRENLYLNGAILGMRRAEIDRKFDEIVAFAEVERFVDTAVKHYSSGMYVRLAFAVAAYLEPEILVVDEVLSVGDAAFQQKCLARMDMVAGEGRTILFVSHNLMAVKQLCTSALWIDAGKTRMQGACSEVVAAYTSASVAKPDAAFAGSRITGDGRVRFVSYQVANAGSLEIGDDVEIQVRVRVEEPIQYPNFHLSITNEYGVLISQINTVEQGVTVAPLAAGDATVTVMLRRITFLPGRYTATFSVLNPQCHIYARAEDAISFEVEQTGLFGTRQVDRTWGCVYTEIDFRVES